MTGQKGEHQGVLAYEALQTYKIRIGWSGFPQRLWGRRALLLSWGVRHNSCGKQTCIFVAASFFVLSSFLFVQVRFVVLGFVKFVETALFTLLRFTPVVLPLTMFAADCS